MAINKPRTKGNPKWFRNRATIIEGRVIGPRFGKALAIAGMGFFVMIIITVAFYWAIDTSFKNVNPVMARWIGYMGAAAILVLIGGGIALYLLIRFRRLVVGEDRLQLVGSFRRLLGQIPYENLDDVQSGRIIGNDADVQIRLYDRRRRDTWWPRMVEDEPYDILIRGGFEMDGTALRLLLRDTLHEYRARHGLLK